MSAVPQLSIRKTRLTGTGERESPFAENPWMQSGAASHATCWPSSPSNPSPQDQRRTAGDPFETVTNGSNRGSKGG